MSQQSFIASAGGLNFADIARAVASKTVRELTSGTSGLAFAQLVAARAAIQLATLVNAINFCRVEMVPPGGGKVYHFQRVAVPAAGSFESIYDEANAVGNDIAPTDATLGDVPATLAVFAVRTDITDLAQRQAAINLAEAIGIAHGNALNRAMNGDIYASLANATTNVISKGAANDGISTNYGYSDIFAARGYVERARGRPDTLVTYPYSPAVGANGVDCGFYPFVNSNITSVQFATALAGYLQSGKIAELFSLKLYLDAVYEPSNIAANGSRLGDVLQGGEAVGWAQAEDIISEIQRWAVMVGFRLVTHSTGKSGRVQDPFITHMKHA
jgi:hypothetical protein